MRAEIIGLGAYHRHSENACPIGFGVSAGYHRRTTAEKNTSGGYEKGFELRLSISGGRALMVGQFRANDLTWSRGRPNSISLILSNLKFESLGTIGHLLKHRYLNNEQDLISPTY
jgi:hypothetical protein